MTVVFRFASILIVLLSCCSGAGAQCVPANCNGHGICAGTSCFCFAGYAGPGCSRCGSNYYNYPTCTFCLASFTCGGHGVCNALGGCDCNVGFAGPNCMQCAPGWVGYPACHRCHQDVNADGALSVQDIFDFFVAFFSGLPQGDFNGVGGISTQDLFDFLAAFFGGCS